MTANDYPEFVQGQTLTADELNLLAEHAWHRDRLVGRMTGFGVNCGLTGAFSGSTLTVQPGLAVDQSGEPLVMLAARTIAFPKNPLDSTAYPFISTSPGGWSVVLRATDTVVPAPPCTEDDCSGHSTTHTAGVTLEVVPGRVTGARFDFASHPALALEPMRLSQTAQPVGSYATLRDEIAKILLNAPGTPLVATSIIDALKATSIAPGDLVGVKGYKVAWINTVLAALIDFLRCRALMSTECLRDDSEPGVVLGWVTQSGTTWSFSCNYRHAWEPPKGLSQAFVGGMCGDPCGKSHDFLESVLTGYAPPDPPPDPTPPPSGGGGIIIWDPPLIFCKKGYVLINGHCTNLHWPGIDLIEVDLIPFDPEIYFELPWVLTEDPAIRVAGDLITNYGTTPFNTLGDGVIDAGGLLGQYGVNVEATIRNAVKGHGVEPDVQITTAAQIKDIAGFEPGTSFSPSDQVVIMVDGKGLAVGMGHVPALVSVRQSGTAIPEARKAVQKVDGAVAQIGEIAAGVEQGFKEYDGRIKGLQESFGGLQEELINVKGGVYDASGFGMRIAVLEQQSKQFGPQGERIAKIEGQLGVRVAGAGNYRPDIAKGIQEFAQSTIEAIKTIDQPENKNLPRYVAAAERSQAEFEIAVAAEDEKTVGLATVELLDSMRTMVKAAGIDESLGRKIDAQFREVQGMFS